MPKNQIKRVGLLRPKNQVKPVGLLADIKKNARQADGIWILRVA